ncbi:MAG: alkaline phosphatase family protein [Phycisphaerae bacterium]|nr:alkaline phosphatase family protein [Phycisphaerae bacterium]
MSTLSPLRHSFGPSIRTCWLLFAAVLLSGGCSGLSGGMKLRPEVKIPERSAVIFFADGLERARLDELLAAGELPNIDALFVKGGTRIERVVVALPSVTYANTVTLLTGEHPSVHGVVGNHWFDPKTLEYRNYTTPATYLSVNDDITQPTIFERLDDELTANIKCPTHRGVDEEFLNPISTGLQWVAGDLEGSDRSTADRLRSIVEESNKLRQWPDLTLLYFPGVDETAHRYGSDTARYRSALRNLDAQIGRTVELLRANGVHGQTNYVLVTDHSHRHAPPEHRIDLIADYVRAFGARPWMRETRGWNTQPRRAAALRDQEVVATIASRAVVFHVKHGSSWEAGWSAGIVPGSPAEAKVGEIAEFLRNSPAIGVVCARGASENEIQVSRRIGGSTQSATILRIPSEPVKYEYRVDDGVDPLGYLGSSPLREFAQSGPQPADGWLRATILSDYPDLVPQMAEMFRQPRGGDVIGFAADDWLLYRTNASGHGSVLSSDCVVSYFFAGPGVIAGGSVPFARSTCLTPTVLELLGVVPPAMTGPLGGVSLKDALMRFSP